MKRLVTSTFVAALAIVPLARAQADSKPTVELNPAIPIQVPATLQGRNGAPETQTLSFLLEGFTNGATPGTVCAVGTLRSAKGTSGATKLPPTRVAFPANDATQADCAGAIGGDGGDGEDEHGGFGGFGLRDRQPGARPALYTTPWNGLVQHATYNGSAPFIVPARVCQVLNLVLGPIHLNLLGLVLDTNTIRLDLTGNTQLGLLGSILCALVPA